MITRDEIAHKESTRDPIFLFQTRIILPTLDADVEYDGFLESLVVNGTEEQIDNHDLLDSGWAYDDIWKTIDVFATREEGEDFGMKTSYRYGSRGKGVDWRVFCIALEEDSILAKLLKKHWGEINGME